MQISVILTTLNEEKGIHKLMDSLVSQSITPHEIIIVDGGSIDKTINILKNYSSKYKYIKIFSKKGNIAKGRNFAISKAKFSIIAQIDAGCMAHKNWLKEITMPFKASNVNVVAGFYKMVSTSNFQKAASVFLGVTPKDYNKNFLPSGRSIAFKKSVWKKVGGYDESLSKAAEDTFFNYKLIKNGVEIHHAKNAIVYWQVPGFFLFSKKLFSYAKGDAQAKIWWHPVQKFKTHNIKILLIFVRYFLSLIISGNLSLKFGFWGYLFAPFFLYILWPFLKFYKYNFSFGLLIWMPFLQFISDFMVMLGFLSGII